MGNTQNDFTQMISSYYLLIDCYHQLDYENSSGEIAVTTFYYDEDGIMHDAYWETRDGSQYSKNIYRYNGCVFHAYILPDSRVQLPQRAVFSHQLHFLALKLI